MEGVLRGCGRVALQAKYKAEARSKDRSIAMRQKRQGRYLMDQDGIETYTILEPDGRT